MNFEKPKGQRLHKRFLGIEVIESDKCWWCNNRWMTTEEVLSSKKSYSNFVKCRTLKAFKRHLKRYGIKGIKYTLVSFYIGYNITAYGRNNDNTIP